MRHCLYVLLCFFFFSSGAQGIESLAIKARPIHGLARNPNVSVMVSISNNYAIELDFMKRYLSWQSKYSETIVGSMDESKGYQVQLGFRRYNEMSNQQSFIGVLTSYNLTEFNNFSLVEDWRSVPFSFYSTGDYIIEKWQITPIIGFQTTFAQRIIFEGYVGIGFTMVKNERTVIQDHVIPTAIGTSDEISSMGVSSRLAISLGFLIFDNRPQFTTP